MRVMARWALGVSLAAWFAATAFAQDAMLGRAKELLDKGDARGAYAVLKPLEPDRAGNPEFDLLLGTAAVETGRPSEAVFALERVLAVVPNHPVARALIARAYFQLGERKTARQEFESARQLSPPAEVTATIQRFLDAIERLDAGIETKLTGYLEASAGHDSNVNSATSSSQVAVPLFGGALFTLSATGVKADNNFLSLGGGLNFQHSFRRGLSVVAGADVSKRVNETQDAFNTGSLSAYGGVNVIEGRNSFTAVLQVQQFYVGHDRFRDAFGITGQWQHALDDFNSLAAYVQLTRLEYPGQEVRDADRTVAGVGYARALAGDRRPIVFLGAYAGEERERRSGVPHLGHDLWGLRVGGQLSLTPELTLFASGSYEQRDYGGPDPLFLVTREDKQQDLRLGLSYVPEKLWTITPQISNTRNESNVVTSDFKRSVFWITVRRDLR
jgi:tetratricopeptide (TPR) repeat protein